MEGSLIERITEHIFEGGSDGLDADCDMIKVMRYYDPKCEKLWGLAELYKTNDLIQLSVDKLQQDHNSECDEEKLACQRAKARMRNRFRKKSSDQTQTPVFVFKPPTQNADNPQEESKEFKPIFSFSKSAKDV